mmetsp:Transcript_7390/g.13082  ORF Transcript_7390/g.13082 Transcript_7390/m.13082 type:complete len:498 (+) Transcript_7390:3-1496(+)
MNDHQEISQQLGWVSIKASLTDANTGEVKTQTNRVSADGLIIQGGVGVPYCQGNDIGSEFESKVQKVIPRWHLPDPRATQLLITPVKDSWWLISAPEHFSQHSGTCRILGDKDHSSELLQLKLGMFLRLGCVGLVVSEVHTGGPEGQKILADEELRCLQEATLATKPRIRAMTAAEEMQELEDTGEEQATYRAHTIRETLRCYMCFDDSEEDDNPLVAPCECKSDTRYAHLKCLQKWYASSFGDQVCVAYSPTGAHVCNVCKTPYKTHVILKDGTASDLHPPALKPPYICFTVVTRRPNSDECLFSTKYQLSFDTVLNGSRTQSIRGMVIGRAHECDMVLNNYRGMSSYHAMVRYGRGTFSLEDLRSVNGSLLYLREPVRLTHGATVRLRWGRSTVALRAARPWRARLAWLCLGRKGGTGRGDGGAGRAPEDSSEEEEEQRFDLLRNLASWENIPPGDFLPGEGPARTGVRGSIASDDGGVGYVRSRIPTEIIQIGL